MKNLSKIIGTGIIGLIGLNLNAQYNSFSKRDYAEYSLSHYFGDISEDSINDVVVIDYDLNQNGKKDTRGVFLIKGKKELSNKDVIYYTEDNAFMLIFDKNEDGVDDELFVDTDLDGILDRRIVLGKNKKDLGFKL